MAVELVLDAKAIVAEGVCWDARRGLLYWVDILAKQVHLFDPRTHHDRCIQLDQYVGAVVPSQGEALLVAMQYGLAWLDLRTEHVEPICDPERHRPDNRFNDGKCDPAGRFWCGTMQVTPTSKAGSLYRLDPDGRVSRMIEGVGVSNGLAWDVERRVMYYIDTTDHCVSAFDYDPATGAIRNRRTVVDFPDHAEHPDGMTIDAEGTLWVACFGGGRVVRCDPRSGRMLCEVRFPATEITNCTFGGDDLDTLYVSSARVLLDDKQRAAQPSAGGLFAVRPGVRGRPATPFAGAGPR